MPIALAIVLLIGVAALWLMAGTEWMRALWQIAVFVSFWTCVVFAINYVQEIHEYSKVAAGCVG